MRRKLTTLVTLLFTLSILMSITSFAFANRDWNISGTYYDSIYITDPLYNTSADGSSALRTYGTCTLYVTKGNTWSIYIDPRFSSGSGIYATVLDSLGRVHYADSCSGYKGKNGWYPSTMDYGRVSGENYSVAQPYDGKPRTVWCAITPSDAMNDYWRGKVDFNGLLSRSNIRVTINVRQNPAEQSSIGGDEIL